MRPTIRGWTVLVAVAAAMAMAWQYGPRALNALVTPLLVVFVAGLVTTVRTNRPEIERSPVPDGAVGDRRTVGIGLETGAAVSATVSDAVGDGLTVTAVGTGGTTDTGDGSRIGHPAAETILEGDDRFEYEIRLEERGEHSLGPVTITVSDVLGLFRRRFTVEASTTVLVYPPVRELRSGSARELGTTLDVIAGSDREEFDRLREYQRGDSLRDVHWKSAARRPDADLIVTEYATEETGAVTVAADCGPGRDDELATAVASVTVHLLEAGVRVGVVLPDADLEPGSGRDHRYDLLARLARLEAGELGDRRREAADVVVRADAEGTRVVADGRTIPFERLADDTDARGEEDDRGRDGRSVRTGRDRPETDAPGEHP